MRITRRQFVKSSAILAGTGLCASTARGLSEAKPRFEMGILLYSYSIQARIHKDRKFADPVSFLDFCSRRGAAGVQLPFGRLDAKTSAEIRSRSEQLGMYVEGVVRPPADANDIERFESEIVTARDCGAIVLRTVMLGGRRYEVFSRRDEYGRFAMEARASLRLAEPIMRKHGLKLAVENHKDFRTDELVDLLKEIASEYLGVCVDTGNNIALLEDPLETVRALAPFALTVHLKDMGVEEAPDGFRLAEVPLGSGFLDVTAIVEILRRVKPRIRLNLEMITRDPLAIPCLTEKYWKTLDRVPGRDLARTLAMVRRAKPRAPLARVTGLTPEEMLELEDRNVRESFRFAKG